MLAQCLQGQVGLHEVAGDLELVDLRVIPYNLHQLDRVRGAAHFEVPIATGRQIVRGLRERLPGYAVPRYVNEAPGETSKTVII